jgi:hypothetical protein
MWPKAKAQQGQPTGRETSLASKIVKHANADNKHIRPYGWASAILLGVAPPLHSFESNTMFKQSAGSYQSRLEFKSSNKGFGGKKESPRGIQNAHSCQKKAHVVYKTRTAAKSVHS